MRVGNALENKENARPWGDSGGEYREDYASESERVAAKLARKESLNIKLALRPDRQELINRSVSQRSERANEYASESESFVAYLKWTRINQPYVL